MKISLEVFQIKWRNNKENFGNIEIFDIAQNSGDSNEISWQICKELRKSIEFLSPAIWDCLFFK